MLININIVNILPKFYELIFILLLSDKFIGLKIC